MQKTRKDILDYLANHPGAAAGDIARYLDLTPANIRYHLEILVNKNLVQVSGERKAGHAGRPILLYNLSRISLGENISHLTRSIISVLTESRTPLRDIARSFLGDRPDWSLRGIPLWNQAVEIMDQFGYQASWKATREGPQLELKHCPYLDLAKEDSTICQIDEAILSELLQVDTVLVKKRHFGPDPYSPCIFTSK
jgi:predicted ArsR family transcriptional regulator